MSPTQKRRERERQRHRRDILHAALVAFGEQGYEQTTMAHIAARAEFAVGTLYKYFKNKQDLYDALIEGVFQETAEIVRQVLTGPGDELERVERLIEATTHQLFTHRQLATIFFAESLGGYFAPKVGLNNELRELVLQCDDMLEDVMAAGIAKGMFVDLPPRILVASLHGLSNGIHNEVLTGGSDSSDESTLTEKQVVAYRKQIFLDAVLIKQ